jgi:hypothetical protein
VCSITPVHQVGVAILYLIFACVCMLCLLFLYFDVPETQGHNADAKGKAHHDTERPATPARSPRARSPRMMLQTRQSSAAQVRVRVVWIWDASSVCDTAHVSDWSKVPVRRLGHCVADSLCIGAAVC